MTWDAQTRSWLATLTLGGLGALINLMPLPLYPAIDFLLGPTLVMIAAVAGGPWRGALAGFLTSLPTWMLWGEWFGILQFTLEGLVVGALAPRLMVLFLAPLYWITLGVPLLFFHVSHFVTIPPPEVVTWTIIWTIAVKLILNALVYGAIAEAILLHTRSRRVIRHFQPDAPLPALTIPRFLVVTMVMMAGLPTLLLTADGTSRTWNDDVREAWAQSLFAASGAALDLKNATDAGALTLPISATELAIIQRLLHQNQTPHLRAISLVDPQGRVIASSGPPPEPRILADLPFHTPSGTRSIIPRVGESPAFLRAVGHAHVGYASLGRNGLFTLAEVDNAALLSSITLRIAQSLFLLATIWAFGFLLGSLLSPVITRPWLRLSLALDRISKGDLSTRTAFEELEEANALGQSFNHMAERQDAAVSALMETNRKLELALEELRALHKVKGTFLNAVSHDLRIPLTSILGYAEFLQEGLGGSLSATQEGFANQIIDATHYMTRLLNELLDFARMEAGRFMIDPEPLDYSEFLTRIAETFRNEAERKGVAMHMEVPRPLSLVADPDRLTQILNNLVSNALKFTPSGGQVTLRARTTADGVCTEIRDTGVGIPPEAMEHLFETFFQTEAGKAAGGSGLGLSIVKSLIEAHGGRIDVDSIPGQGSVFWFVLPENPTPPDEP